MLKYIIGFAALVVVVAIGSISYAESNAQTGCSIVAKSATEVCVRSNNHIPCLLDITGKSANYYCYKHVMPEDLYLESGLCRVLLQEVPCGPGCIDYEEINCCCFEPGEPKAAP